MEACSSRFKIELFTILPILGVFCIHSEKGKKNTQNCQYIENSNFQSRITGFHQNPVFPRVGAEKMSSFGTFSTTFPWRSTYHRESSHFSKMSIFRDFSNIWHNVLTFWGTPGKKKINFDNIQPFCVWI